MDNNIHMEVADLPGPFNLSELATELIQIDPISYVMRTRHINLASRYTDHGRMRDNYVEILTDDELQQIFRTCGVIISDTVILGQLTTLINQGLSWYFSPQREIKPTSGGEADHKTPVVFLYSFVIYIILLGPFGGVGGTSTLRMNDAINLLVGEYWSKLEQPGSHGTIDTYASTKSTSCVLRIVLCIIVAFLAKK
jgi:hypothetical protein